MIKLFRIKGDNKSFPNINVDYNLVSAKYYTITQEGPNLPIKIRFYSIDKTDEFDVDLSENSDFRIECFDENILDWVVIETKEKYYTPNINESHSLTYSEKSSAFFVNILNSIKKLIK